jgi:hypothetical protein
MTGVWATSPLVVIALGGRCPFAVLPTYDHRIERP